VIHVTSGHFEQIWIRPLSASLSFLLQQLS